MFTKKTYLDKSKIDGIGVFADEFIPKGEVIWKFVDGFDVVIDDAKFKLLPKNAQDWILHYGYYNKAEGGGTCFVWTMPNILITQLLLICERLISR